MRQSGMLKQFGVRSAEKNNTTIGSNRIVKTIRMATDLISPLYEKKLFNALEDYRSPRLKLAN